MKLNLPKVPARPVPPSSRRVIITPPPLVNASGVAAMLDANQRVRPGVTQPASSLLHVAEQIAPFDTQETRQASIAAQQRLRLAHRAAAHRRGLNIA